MPNSPRVPRLRSWHLYTVTPGVDVTKPGLYEWIIEGVGSYIGQYGRIGRPTKAYARNVARLIAGGDYRTGSPMGFRRIHRELAFAHREGRRIELVILENGERPALNDREREVIRERGALNDPPFGKRLTL